MKKFILAALSLVASCSLAGAKSSNITITDKFTGIDVSANIEVVYTASATVSAKAIYDAPDCDLSVSVRDGVLYLDRKSNGNNNKGKMKVILNAPIVSGYRLSGASEISIRSMASFDRLSAELSGASELKFLSVSASTITINTSGASEVEFENIMCENMNVVADGASDVSADGVTATGLTLKSSGTSEIELERVVASSVNATASGASKIELDGTTGTVRYSTSGTARIEAVELTANGGSAEASGASFIKCHVTGLHKSVSGTARINNI